MRQYKKSAQLKDMAKDQLMGKWGLSILVTFVSSLITVMVSFSLALTQTNTMNTMYNASGSVTGVTFVSVLFYAISVVASIILTIMNLGITLFFLNIACGQPYSFKDLFYGYRERTNTALALAAAMVLVEVVTLAPYQFVLDRYLENGESTYLVAGIVLGIVGLCIYVPFSLAFSISYFLMLDFPQYGAKELLKLCLKVMKGQKKRLFYIQLSFIPLMLLCILSFGVGFLWLTPYMQMTYTYFFLDVMQPEEVA